MPTLPTLTVTQEQADRMIAAWGSAASYSEWLKQQIIDFVLNKEAVDRQRAWMVQEEQRRAADRAALGG
jgi:hypothetical protein